MTAMYRLIHEMDAALWRPGKDHHRQVRWQHRHGGEQRVPEDRGLPGRVGQRPPLMLDTEELVTVEAGGGVGAIEMKQKFVAYLNRFKAATVAC